MACMARSAFLRSGSLRTAEGRGHNLPGQAEFVLEPSAFRFLAAVGDQSVPEVVHLFLALDADEEGDRLVELVFWTAIEGGVELLPSSSKLAMKSLTVSTLALGNTDL